MILSDRTIEEMQGCAGQLSESSGWRGGSALEGWREPLVCGHGFTHRYERDVGEGGWEFHQLNDALSIAVVDFRAAHEISRSHRHDDHLVFCAMVEGRSSICADGDPTHEELAHGFCTFFGFAHGDAVHTVYEPNRALRYVTVFLRRDRIKDVLGLDAHALPGIFRDYILHRTPIGLRHVPLGSGASIAASQALECGHKGELRRLYLTAKSIEIVCSVIQSHAEAIEAEEPVLRRADIERIRSAKRIIEENLGEPLSVSELASAVGMTVKKLQQGFQALFRGSVGQIYKQVRLSRAMALVSGGDMSMIDIAIECGYECPGSFTRAFKLAFGSSPTLVRATALRGAMAEPSPHRAGFPSAWAAAALVN